MPMQDDGAVPYSTEGSMGDTEGATQGGVRVLVGNSARNRADTSAESPSGSGWWRGTAVGLICPEPPTGEECETILCRDPATCIDRFADESTGGTADDGTYEIGTAEVDCNGKQGRYVTIELPGLTATETNMIRTLGLTEVRVEGGSAEEETSIVPYLVVGGVVALVLVTAVGVWFAQGDSQAGPSRPIDAAAFAGNDVRPGR
eukprot:g18505.t1